MLIEGESLTKKNTKLCDAYKEHKPYVARVLVTIACEPIIYLIQYPITERKTLLWLLIKKQKKMTKTYVLFLFFKFG